MQLIPALHVDDVSRTWISCQRPGLLLNFFEGSFMLSQVLHSNTATFHCETNVTRADRQRTDHTTEKVDEYNRYQPMDVHQC